MTDLIKKEKPLSRENSVVFGYTNKFNYLLYFLGQERFLRKLL